MYKFVLLLACLTLVQGLMPMLKIRKDVNRIDFGDVKPHHRELRRQQRHAQGYDQGYGYAPAHGYGEQGYDHGQYAGQTHQFNLGHASPYPKFYAYYNAGGKRGLGGRRNKGGVQYGLLLG